MRNSYSKCALKLLNLKDADHNASSRYKTLHDLFHEPLEHWTHTEGAPTS